MTNFYLHICENGHLKTDFKRVRPGDTGSVCGAKMIDSCPECGELIKKWYYYGSVPRGPKPNDSMRPEKCRVCGAEFRWKSDV